MAAVTNLPMYRYLVAYDAGGDTAEHDVEACYIQEEGSLVMLKGASHEIVYAVPSHRLLSVLRGELVG